MVEGQLHLELVIWIFFTLSVFFISLVLQKVLLLVTLCSRFYSHVASIFCTTDGIYFINMPKQKLRRRDDFLQSFTFHLQWVYIYLSVCLSVCLSIYLYTLYTYIYIHIHKINILYTCITYIHIYTYINTHRHPHTYHIYLYNVHNKRRSWCKKQIM